MEAKEFHYEVKAPDRVFWHFRGTILSEEEPGDEPQHWRVEVTQESNEDGIGFDMFTVNGQTPSLIDVFSAFQAKVASLLNPIAWDIHYQRNTGMK